MFCSYLKKSNSKTSNATDAMDWFEVRDLCSVNVNAALSLYRFQYPFGL